MLGCRVEKFGDRSWPLNCWSALCATTLCRRPQQRRGK